MDLLGALWLLWHRRLLVGVGAIVATALAAALVQGVSLGPLGSVGGPDSVGVGSGTVLLDTPKSQLLHPEPKGAETLPMRTLLFADLLAREDVKARIAREAGLAPKELDVLPPSSRGEPLVSTPLVEQAAAVATVPVAPVVLSVYADGESPMITIDAHAPDSLRAKAVVEAAMSAVKSLFEREGDTQYRVDAVTEAHAKDVVSGSRGPALALIAAIAVFALWCGAIVVVASPRLRAA
jgi:hypothetical protein